MVIFIKDSSVNHFQN